MKKILKTTTIDLLKYAAFTALFIMVSTVTASNKKSISTEFKNGDLLSASNLSNMKIDWNNIYNKPVLNWKEETITYRMTNIGGICSAIGPTEWRQKSHYIDLPKYTKNLHLLSGDNSVTFAYDGLEQFGWHGHDCKVRNTGYIRCDNSYNGEGGLPTDRLPNNSRIRLKIVSSCYENAAAKLKVTYLIPGGNAPQESSYTTEIEPNLYEGSTAITIVE